MRKGTLTSLILPGLLFAALAVADADDDRDWRKQASLEDKVEKLIATMPSTSTLMIEVGERYQDLYWAARLGKWAFAEYQLEEIESLVELLQITRPGRAATAQVFLDEGLGGFEAAFEAKDLNAFQRAFRNLHAQCMACHVANDHAFIELPEQPVTASSVILNLPRQ
jgi:hypothetical protein